VEAARPQPATEPSPTPPVPSLAEVHQQQASVTSPAKDHETPAQLTSPLPAAQQSTEQTPAPTSTAALAPSASDVPAPKKVDYGWLAGILLPRIEAQKEYPMDARLKHVEGRVVVRIVIQEDGQIVSAAVAKSSGHDTLDQAALETVRKISPIALTQPLEQSPVTLHIPIRYQLGP
jgi:protein TonB